MKIEANVLIYVMIYLAAMVLVVPLAKKLGLGVVLGYLLAGIAIGPFGLAWVANNASVTLLAELGVVLMLFTIGLELDLNRLWSLRHRVFGFGVMQLCMCGAILTIGVYSLGLSMMAASLLGLTLALSSTAVAVQLMNDRNLMGTSVGQSTFGVLLFQDMAAIPLLIIISVMFPSQGAKPFMPVYALLAVVCLIVVGKYGLAYALRWVAQYGSRELFVGGALLLVIGVMELMTMVGVSSGLGAFIAGVLLASSEYRHELEADLEPFKGLFLGLFFITIGSNIDLLLLREHWLPILGLLVLFMCVKMGLLYLQALFLKMGRRERLSFAVLLGQGGEFGFVISSLAVSGAMVSAQYGAWLNMVIALSIAASPLLMKLHDAYVARFMQQDTHPGVVDQDMAHHPVIIAGFGRYGQIVGRLLLSNGIRSTVLDHDSEHIESMRQFGFKIYYGDATRLDLLETAGAHKAKVLVIAVDDKDAINAIATVAKKHFPHLHVMARAVDVAHMYELLKLDIDVIHRELFESSLMLGRDVLVQLGYGRYEAKEMTDMFRRTNVAQLHSFAQLRDETNRKDFIKALRASREELERQLQAQTQHTHVVHTWQEDKLRKQSPKL